VTTVNPILAPTALLRPQAPGVYGREMIYDPTWESSAYTAYEGQRIVPAIDSIVRDTDGTPLWVVGIDEVTLYPTYAAASLGTANENIVSLLDYGNSLLRLYVDTRQAP